MGCPCVFVFEFIEVYEGFGDREEEGRMVARSRVCVYGGRLEVGVSNSRDLGQEGFVVTVLCA